MIQRAVAVVSVLPLLIACARRPQVASAPACLPDWRAVWTGDSTIALCLPRTFQPRSAEFGHFVWSRDSAGVPTDFLSLTLLRWPQDSASLHSWPPHLASPPACQADCSAVDSLSVHSDEVAGLPARTEVALVSGGWNGMRRQPTLLMAWVVSARRRGFAIGAAANAATLDTMRMAVRTLRAAL